MTDDELIEWIKNDPTFTANGRRIHEILARIVIEMRKQGVKCGGFIYAGNESYGLHNMTDEYGDYAHLGKMQDYVQRFGNDVINFDPD